MTYEFANNAKSTLAAPLTTSSTSVALSAGTGALFPSPTGGDLFVLTLTDAATGAITEIMHATARSGDTLTVVRAQEGTTALNWTTGDFANLVITAGTLDQFEQTGGALGTMAVQNANSVAITGGSIDVSTLKVGGVAVLANPLTTKGDILVDNGTAAVRMAVGSNGQVFTVDSTQPTGTKWATPAATLTNPMTTIGDLIVGGTAGAPARLAVGSPGQVMTANPGAAFGVDWETPTTGGTNLQWVVVSGYTDTEMDAAVTAINASTYGGVIYLGPGVFNWTTTKTFTKPVTIIGCGCADALMMNAITKATFNSTTADMLKFTVDPFQVRDVHLKNIAGSAPTAGCGIHSTGNNGGHRLLNVTTQGFWNNWQIDAQGDWCWTDSVSYGPVNYGAYIRNTAVPDGGDQGIVNCHFIADTYNSVASIRWESGGGLRITNCKFNSASGFSPTTGIDINMVTGSVTSDFLLSNTSIENTSGSSIRARNASGATLTNIKISGVQMANYGSTTPPIDIQATTTGTFDRCILSDLIFSNGSSSVAAINLVNVSNAGIGICAQIGHSQLVSSSGGTGIRNDNARLGTLQISTTTGAIPVDCLNEESFNLSLTGNGTLALPINCQSGTTGSIRIHGNGHTLALASGWKCPGGVAPTLSSSNFDIWSFQYDGFDNTFALVAVQNFS